MNWANIEGKWDTFKGKARTKWSEVTHEAEKQLDELLAKLDKKVSPKKDDSEQPPS